jgi:hypothetical protein
MKKMNLLVVAISICMSNIIYAQSVKSITDSTKLLNGRITIIYKDHDSIKSPKRIEFSTRKNKHRDRFETEWITFDLGLANYLDKTYPLPLNIATPLPTPSSEFLSLLGTNQSKRDFELKTGKSINVNFGIVKARWSLYKNYINLVSGLTYDINSYSYKSSIRWNKAPDFQQLFPREEFVSRDSMSFKKNKLVTNYLQAPLLLRFETNPLRTKRNLTLSAGLYIGYLMRVHTKKMEKGSSEKIKEYDDYNIKKVQYGTQFELSYRETSIYFKHSITPLTEFGAKQYPYCFGVRLLGL